MRTIGILAGKGGVGKTTVAINMASALGMMNKRVGLIDFNFTTSHLSLSLGVIPEVTFNHVLCNQADIDEAIYPVFNFSIIPASVNLMDLRGMEIINLKDTIKRSLDRFDYIILDSAPGFGREALLTIDSSDDVIIVTNPTVTSITDAIKSRQLAEQMGVNVLGVVINRYRGERYEVNPAEVVRLIGAPLLAIVKEDPEFLRTEALRKPMVFHNRKKSEEFFRLASLSTGENYKRRKGFFGRLMSRIRG